LNSVFAKRLEVRRMSCHTFSLEVCISKTGSNVVLLNSVFCQKRTPSLSHK